MRRNLILKAAVVAAGLVTVSAQAASNWYPSGAITQADQIALKPLTCPTIGKDHSQMISQLNALQDKIRSDANCNKLIENIEEISMISGERRQDFLEAIEKLHSGETLNDKTIQKNVIDYAQDVTVLAGSLATLLSESGQCFNEQDRSRSLFTLAAFVNEASALVSTVAGPWGPALAIGGKVVAGFLTGINKLIETMPGYNFRDKKDWQGYVETLCTFHEQQDEVQAIIHPDKAIQNLGALKNNVHQTLDFVLSSTSYRDELMSSFANQDEQSLALTAEKIHNETGSLDGLKAIRLLTAERWIKARIETIDKEANDPLAPGAYLVQTQRDEIENFLIARQAPNFLEFQVSETNKALRQLERFLAVDGQTLYNQVQQFRGKETDTGFFRPYKPIDEIFKELLSLQDTEFYGKSVDGNQIYSSLVYFRRELQKKWDAITIAYGVKVSFCAFFERAGYYNNAIRNSCTSRDTVAVEGDIKNFESKGLGDSTPSYLYRLSESRGTNWTEALDTWVNELK
ncbi:MAG: hypothetical protein KDD22_02550 [Bdellovibrionales bacterium]|nr:hypothetical protein [Bdellovibrionales bacterium]